MLDWTVIDEPEEPERPQTSSPKQPPQPPRWRWPAILALLILVSGAWIWWATQHQTQERRTRAVEAVADQPLPPPLPGLVALDRPVVETAVERPGGALEVTAIHAYKGVEGTRLSFRATRVYEPDGSLRPSSLVTTTLDGPILRIVYEISDAELVTNDLAPFLDSVLSSACDQWQCPADVHLTLDLTGEHTKSPPSIDGSRPVPANRVFAYASSFVVVSETLHLPRPTANGTPADDDTRSYWRRAIADAALVQLALQVRAHPEERFFAPSLTHNAFFYALVLRQAARSGVEDEQWLTLMMPAEPGQTMADLWSTQTRMDHAPLAEEVELRAALGFLNPLIGQDEQLERLLFRQLSPETGLDAWLARAFAGAGRSALDTLFNLTGDSTKRLLDDLARPGSDWIAIGSCAGGQVIWTPIGDELHLGLSTDVPAPARIVGARWTRSGLDLAVALGDQIAFRSAATGEFKWAAGAGSGGSAFAGWMGSLAALYRFDAGQPTQDIVLVHPDAPDEIVATLSDVADLVPAPNGDLGITLGPSVMDPGAPASGGQILHTVMPLAELNIRVGAGFIPAWAPDGQRLAVILGPGAETPWGGPFSIGILPDATQPGFAREIWSPDLVGQDGPGTSGVGAIAWAPTGAKVAALIGLQSPTASSLDFSGWIFSLNGLQTVDKNRIALEIPERVDAVTQIDFSNDGRFLSATFWRLGRPEVRWYDPETGAVLRQATDVTRVAWSPTGHRAILLSSAGAALAARPEDASEPLVGVGCKEVLWNPTAPP